MKSMSEVKDFFENQWKVLTVLPNGTEVSTVELPGMSGSVPLWETCLFYTNDSSNVVAQYSSIEEAVKGHSFLVEHELNHAVAGSKHHA